MEEWTSSIVESGERIKTSLKKRAFSQGSKESIASLYSGNRV
jgi:hypothetical protein